VIRYPDVQFADRTEDRYIALAWNYEQAVLISSSDHASYTDARAELDRTCAELGVTLRWFDGEYTFDGKSGTILPLE
jgi:hypothetical protein